MTTQVARRPRQEYMNRPLTLEEMEARAPSIFATTSYKRSERYRFIPTSRVLRALREEGFLPYMVAQSSTRDEAKRGHVKHLIRLRKEGSVNQDGEFAEVVLIGSHDGSSAFILIGGYFRLVCTNGLVCGHDMGEIRVPHMGENVIRMSVQGAHKIVHQLVKMDEHRAAMKTITLTKDQKGDFAKEALKLRYGDKPRPVEPDQILVPRQPIDVGNNSVWAVFNTLQQNIIQGGISGWSENNRRIRTRPMNGISPNVDFNRRLWDVAEAYLPQAA